MKLVNFWMEDDLKQELDILSKRERRSLKDILNEQIANYVKEHGDGNPNYSLDQFDQEEMKAVPAMFRTNEDWMSYMNGLNEKEFRELETKIYQLKSISDKRWEKGFD